ncbi:hypothetical protein ABIE24_002872 [Mycetocola sp. 2940]
MKELGRVKGGGGWCAHGRGARPNDKRGLGIRLPTPADSRVAVAQIGAVQRSIKPHRPRTKGAYRQIFTNKAERSPLLTRG